MLRMIAAFRVRFAFCAFSCFLWQTSFACRHQREQWPQKTQRGAKSLAGWKVSDRARAILLGQIRSLYLGWAGVMVTDTPLPKHDEPIDARADWKWFED